MAQLAWLFSACDDPDTSPTPPSKSDASTEGSASNDGRVVTECESTWQALQQSIFRGSSCNNATCHSGAKPAGGLDLSPDAAYDSLVFHASQASLTSPMYRVQPGEQAVSLLYLKLAAQGDPKKLPMGAGAPMPIGRPPISKDQLAALRLWIRAGAPKTGVVFGTQGLLDCSLPKEADPNKSPQPPVPAPDEGFQHAAGPWPVAPNSENEVCFATYYDLSDSAPDWSRMPCDLFNDGKERTCVGYRRRQLSQDAQSHHSIIQVYAGEASASDPSFGKWRCAGGDLEGKACSPTQLGAAECGQKGVCQSEPRKMTTCRGYGPSDRDTRSVGSGGAQSPVSSDTFHEGVYARIPLKGVIVWNSHAFNLTDKATSIEQFNTFWYARPEQRVYLVRGIFDAKNIFSMTVPPFQANEYCATYTLPRYARLTQLSSHVHKRGIEWRTWLPPNPEPNDCPVGSCKPNAGEPVYHSVSYNDPVALDFDPAMVFDDEDPQQRTLKYCAVFDNGKSDPTLVKRRSMLPEGAKACANADTYCMGGALQGTACNGNDARCGAGTCDACTVSGGYTTEDEMFILLGNYYVMPPH